ncbi:hypothetical protein MMC11_003993 [Xylographa trunciseda]|nr:hypothetical protein [Xylographa trunciseda]
MRRGTQTIAAPIAALTMAGLLFVYTRTSIKAAKRNAQQHREADGGQISWRNETLRRHGAIDTPGDKGTVRELVSKAKEEVAVIVDKGRIEEEKIKARRGKRKDSGEEN